MNRHPQKNLTKTTCDQEFSSYGVPVQLIFRLHGLNVPLLGRTPGPPPLKVQASKQQLCLPNHD